MSCPCHFCVPLIMMRFLKSQFDQNLIKINHKSIVIEDTRYCFSAIHPYRVHYVRREANIAAHTLAKSALYRQTDQVWVGECPLTIHRVVAIEQFA